MYGNPLPKKHREGVEHAFKVKIPKNARLVRNLIQGALYVHDHIVHFYHLHGLDWVDVVSALSADPKKFDFDKVAKDAEGYGMAEAPRGALGH